MEFDPLSRDIAPPRHEIESDSEDDNEVQSSSRRAEKIFTPPQVAVELLQAKANPNHLIILQGEGGEALLGALKHSFYEVGKVMVNGVQHGSFAMGADDSSIVLLLRPSIAITKDQSCYSYICSAVLESIEPSNVTIVDSYNAALYLSTEEVYNPPIRYILSFHDASQGALSSELQPYESPNYVDGLGAALLNESAIFKVPATLLLLPQASNSRMQSWSRVHATSSHLDTPPDPLDAELTSSLVAQLPTLQPKTKVSKPTTSIDDFLKLRRSQGRRNLAQSVSGMYV